MNRTILAFAAVSSTLVMSAANAFDGTINFSGQLTNQTCTATVNGSTTSTVTLPTLSATALPAAGNVAGATNFVINLTNCTNTVKTAIAFFEAGPGVDPITKNVRNSNQTATGAKNVQFQLLDPQGTAILAGDTSQTATSNLTARTNVSGATASLPYAVQYVAVGGAAGVGLVTGTVTYSINYQ